MRRREERQTRLRRLEERGRRVPVDVLADAPLSTPPNAPAPIQHEAAAEIAPLEPPVTYDLTSDVPRFEDDLEEELSARRSTLRNGGSIQRPVTATQPRVRARTTFDRVLLAVEVIGVLGIIGVLIFGGYLVITENDKIEALEQKSADIQREADAMNRVTPTPRAELSVRLSDYVLPGGHYSPDQTGGEYAFNLDEVPESLRPIAVAQLTAPQVERATPQPKSPVRIVIDTDAVNVDASIYGGDDWYQLLKGVGHYAGSGNPGEPRNMVLVAHNDIYGEIFRDIQHMEPGDEIRIQSNDNRWYTYVVYNKDIVNPEDVWVLAPGNESIITLITCHPYRVDTHRMIVFGRLVEDRVS